MAVMADAEELRLALANKESEAAQLERSLLEAATLGQELVAENEKLKQQLSEQMAMQHAGGRAQGTLCAQGGERSRAVSDSSSGHSDDDDRPTFPKRRPRVRLETNESDVRDRMALEEEHLALQKRCAELEAELERQGEVSMAALKTDASAISTRSRCVSGVRRVRVRTPQELLSETEGTESTQTTGHLEAVEASEAEEDHVEESSLAQMQMLRVKLQEQTRALAQANARCSMLQEQSDVRHCELAQATRLIAEQSEAKEIDNLRITARMMRKSLCGLSRRASLVEQAEADPPYAPPPQRDVRKGVGGATSSASLAAEMARSNSDELTTENEELTDTIAQLRTQLAKSAAEAVEPKAHGGGPDAAGGISEDAMSSLASVSRSRLVADLQAELAKMHKELEDANTRLMRRKSVAPHMHKENTTRAETFKDLGPETMWERWLLTWCSMVCRSRN